MSNPVPTAPVPTSLRNVRTGKPMGQVLGLSWCHNTAFLLGHTGPCVTLNRCKRLLTGGGVYYLDFTVFYQRTPGVHAVRIAATFDATSLGARATLEILGMPLANGIDWIDPGGFDGTERDIAPPLSLIQTELTGWLDVSGVTVGEIVSFTVRLTSTDHTAGIKTLCVQDVCNSYLEPSDDPGILASSVLHPNLLVDGGSSTATGLRRLQATIDQCREQWSRTIQLVAPQDPALSATLSGSVTSASYVYAVKSHSVDWSCWTRPRRRASTADTDPYTLAVCYYNSAAPAGIAGTLKVRCDGVDLTTISLPGTVPTTGIIFETVVSADGAVELPCNSDEVELDFQVKCDASGPTLAIASIALLGGKLPP